MYFFDLKIFVVRNRKKITNTVKNIFFPRNSKYIILLRWRMKGGNYSGADGAVAYKRPH